jgi:hypothetical protein
MFSVLNEGYIASNSRMAHDQLKNLWKEMIMVKLSSICLRGLKKTTKEISQDGQGLSRDSN